jgi:sulfur transfer complex TusBCD TusB component (DsrH family)
MASICVVLRSAPDTPAGRQALALVESLAREGHTLTLCCLQDAVLLAADRGLEGARETLAGLLARGARCLVLGDDLVTRGLRAGEHACTVDRAGLIAALTAGHDRVVGAF